MNDKLKTFQLTAGRISALMTPLTYLIVNLGVIAILMRGGLQVNSGALTQGEIIALINYMNQVLYNLLRHCLIWWFLSPAHWPAASVFRRF